MHEVFAAMKRRDLSLSPTRTLAVLVASLCMDLCSVGREDEELCADGHPLALTYALDRPQKQAAVAEVLRIATEEGCNIFSAVGAAEARNLKGEREEGTSTSQGTGDCRSRNLGGERERQLNERRASPVVSSSPPVLLPRTRRAHPPLHPRHQPGGTPRAHERARRPP